MAEPKPQASPDRSERADEMSSVLRLVRSVVVEASDGRGVGLIDAGVSFERELGLGSLERVELAVRVGEAFGVQLSEAAIASVDSPSQLLDQIRAAQGRTGEGPPSEPCKDRRSLLPSDPPAPEPVEAATLVDALEAHVRHQPDRVHVVLEADDGTAVPLTYRALHRAALAVALGLRSLGLEPGRSVAIMLPTEVGYLASFMGVLLAGGVPVPLYPPVRLDRIAEYFSRCAKILENAQTPVLITFDRAARVATAARGRVRCLEHVVSASDLMATDLKADHPAVDGSTHGSFARAKVGPLDTALIQYTSGSTGDPKGVELTHANVMANIRAAREGCRLASDDVMVSWLPLYHDMGLIGGWLMCLYFGVPSVLMSPMAFLARPGRWLEALTAYGGTTSVAPNFAFDLCAKRVPDAILPKLDLRRVRSVLNGSEPISVQTIDRFCERFGPVGLRREAIFCAYGLAENMVAVAFPPVLREPLVDRIDRGVLESCGRAEPAPADAADAASFVSVGTAVPGHELRVVDAADQPVPERVQGGIQFRGPSSFKGYLGRPDATARVQRAGGWVDTGDLGYLADGELFITGRAKDLIIKAGRNYYPHEIEAAAASVDGIRQGCVAVFSVQDPQLGSAQMVVAAETRETDPVAREALRGRVVEAVSRAVGTPPDQVVLAMPGAVPKTSSGKIRRSEARAGYLAGTLHRKRASGARQAAGLLVRSLPHRAHRAAKTVGALVYGGYAAVALGSFCAAAPIVGRVVPPGMASCRVAVAQARAALTLAGLRPRARGLHRLPSGPALLVANHSGYLDFLVCTASFPADVRFAIKSELRENRAVGPILARMGHVFVERHRQGRPLEELEEIVALLEDGKKLMVFPEGTFSSDVGMRSFRLGAFKLAARVGLPVVPVAIRGSRRALRDGTWLPKHRRIEVDVLEPQHAGGDTLPDIVALRDTCADAIAARIDEPRLFAAEIRVPGA